MYTFWMCLLLGRVTHVLSVYTNNVTVYASEGDTVVLKCKLFPNSKSTWDKVNFTDTYRFVILYADGMDLNTNLPNIQNLAIVGNINEGDYNLQIQNVSLNDDGIYICSKSSRELGIQEVSVTLRITANIQHSQEVLVRSGDTVILNCTCISQINGNWMGPNRFLSKTNSFNVDKLIPYTEGFRVNTNFKLNLSNIDVVGSYENRTCNLVIKKISIDDEGTYKCQYVENHITNNHVFKVILTNSRTTSPSNDSSVDTPSTSTLVVTSLVNNTTVLVDHLSDDDFKYTFANGYCWIIMGSIVGGVVLSCVCSHIFCYIRRGKTMSEILHLNPDDNYDEVETLNYNNVMFDHVPSDENYINNDNVSSIIESNDIILRADVVSSDDSSSIKQSGDGYENPYQAINPCDIDMHHYSNIVSTNYQNTIIFPHSLSKNTSKFLNISKDSLINHWLVIYKRKQ